MPNVTITPHDSAWSPHTYRRLGALFCENLASFVAGRRMPNEVEGRRGPPCSVSSQRITP